MSDPPVPPVSGGSGYGLGAYGKGPYGFAWRIMGMGATTRIKGLRPQLIAQAQVLILDSMPMRFGLTQMWAPIAVPACQPWLPRIDNCGNCFQAVPNSVGAMFPALAASS